MFTINKLTTDTTPSVWSHLSQILKFLGLQNRDTSNSLNIPAVGHLTIMVGEINPQPHLPLGNLGRWAGLCFLTALFIYLFGHITWLVGP